MSCAQVVGFGIVMFIEIKRVAILEIIFSKYREASQSSRGRWVLWDDEEPEMLVSCAEPRRCIGHAYGNHTNEVIIV